MSSKTPFQLGKEEFMKFKEYLESAEAFETKTHKIREARTIKVTYDGTKYVVTVQNNGYIDITSDKDTYTASPRGRVEFVTLNGKQLSMRDSEKYQPLVDDILVLQKLK